MRPRLLGHAPIGSLAVAIDGIVEFENPLDRTDASPDWLPLEVESRDDIRVAQTSSEGLALRAKASLISSMWV